MEIETTTLIAPGIVKTGAVLTNGPMFERAGLGSGQRDSRANVPLAASELGAASSELGVCRVCEHSELCALWDHTLERGDLPRVKRVSRPPSTYVRISTLVAPHKFHPRPSRRVYLSWL